MPRNLLFVASVAGLAAISSAVPVPVSTRPLDARLADLKVDLETLEKDLQMEAPALFSLREGYVKSGWSSTDKYTTWAAIGILERMIDRATGDPYQSQSPGTMNGPSPSSPSTDNGGY